MDMEMLKRPVNVGFSGGEKKRAEMVQMGILDPKLAILDETDSGLDIDALRVVRRGDQRDHAQAGKAVLLITHYQRLLDYVKPDFVHVLAGGRIVRTGGPELALELEERATRRWRRVIPRARPSHPQPARGLALCDLEAVASADGRCPREADRGHRLAHVGRSRWSMRVAGCGRRSRHPARSSGHRTAVTVEGARLDSTMRC
jgi:ABC-type multidrug transport system ATPase subunit